MRSMNRSLVLISLLVITSCTSIDTTKIAPGYKETYVAIRNSIFGFPDSDISPELIKNIPYASMLLNVGKGPKGLVILESILADQYTWISADEIYLVIRNGKIIETRGFSNNLVDLIDRPLNFKEIISGNISETKAFYSYDKPELKNLGIVLNYEVFAKETIKILDQEKVLLKVEEKGENRIIGWSFTNEYWVDEDFIVWKSKQHISPKIPHINYLVTQKPSK